MLSETDMTLLVAINGWDAQAWVSRLRAAIPSRPVVQIGEPFDRREVHYVAAWKHTHGSLAGLPNLEAIFALGAGVDHVLADPKLPDVPLIRVIDDGLTHQMSEYVVMHTLMHLRQHTRYDAQQRQKIWQDHRDQPLAREVRVGILGCGHLGQDAARKLQMMGFDVAGWNRSAKTVEGVPLFTGMEGLDAFLARTDILVVLLPLTAETKGILNLSLFTKLAQNGRLGGPVVINSGRGGLQVEADILKALETGILKGVTLDVFENEPLPLDSPLWDHTRVTLTPHNAAVSHPEDIAAHVARQIAAIEAGETPLGLVDRTRGY
jgi:glyoxylate/hydroxypyruvate reductase